MSSIDRDPNRKVSRPTEADFIRGIANGADYNKGVASFAAGFLISLISGKARKRGARK